MLPERPFTTDLVLGPFYPVIKPAHAGTDLTVIPGKPGRAQGQVIYVLGQVLDLNGKPVSGAEIEIWQANSFGRYTHPGDTNPVPLDPNFEGYGIQRTDAQGRYRFKTIKPKGYPAGGDRVRPPHIHFCVTSSTTRLITQLFFEGDPLNEKDFLLKNASNKETIITKLMPPTKEVEPDSLIAAWDIVLRQR
jgi:protocatechuate 3,4-dioxygenase, beta subunit